MRGINHRIHLQLWDTAGQVSELEAISSYIILCSIYVNCLGKIP